jgi:hypothetical protein
MVSKIPKKEKPISLKKKLLQTDSLPVSGIPLPDSEQKKMMEMVAFAQMQYNSIKQKIVKEQKREFDALNAQIKEFMGPYMLIGFDLNNNPVEIVSAMDAAENDALLERFRKVLYKINQNMASSNGSDPYGLNS